MQKTSQTLPAAVRPWPLTLARGELCEYGPLFVYAWFATAIACMLLWTRDAIASSAEFLAVSSVSAVAGLAVAYGYLPAREVRPETLPSRVRAPDRLLRRCAARDADVRSGPTQGTCRLGRRRRRARHPRRSLCSCADDLGRRRRWFFRRWRHAGLVQAPLQGRIKRTLGAAFLHLGGLLFFAPTVENPFLGPLAFAGTSPSPARNSTSRCLPFE